MDDDVQRLRREAAARPEDEAAARRLDRALERAGERAELGRRYRMKFECPLRFEQLDPTSDPLERACGQCLKTVRHVRTCDELSAQVAKGGCVAVARSLLDQAGAALAAGGRLHSASDVDRPCVVPTDLAFVDLDAEPPAPEALAELSPELIRSFRAIPVALAGDELRVAVMSWSDLSETLSELRRLTGREVSPVLAAADAFARALERVAPYVEEELLTGLMVEDPFVPSDPDL